MSKSDQLELQKLDCNCNNCIFMIRDMDKYKQSLARHQEWQQAHFDSIKKNFADKANEWKAIGQKAIADGDLEKAEICNKKVQNLMNESNKMRFQFDKSYVSINYGHCDKFGKDVTFIPNLLQLHTQECFKHRREE